MKVLFDDTYYYIEFENTFEDFKCLHGHQFSDCLKILLTAKQYKVFTEVDTAREFNVTINRIKKVLEYMENNIWNKPK